MKKFKIENNNDFVITMSDESFNLQVGSELINLSSFPSIMKLDSNNYVVSEKKDGLSTYYLVNVYDEPILDLKYSSKNSIPLEFNENLLNSGVIIIRPNICYLYSFNFGIVVSSGYDEMNLMDDNYLQVTKKTFHDTYEGVIDFNGHLVNEELFSPKLGKYYSVNEHNLGKSVSDLDKKIMILKNNDYHDYLEDQAHFYKRIKSK